MKDEIKELLINKLDAIEELNKNSVTIMIGELKKTIVYITNLQEENERLKEEKSLIQCDINNAYSWLRDYKSRIDKAIEYIKEIQAFPHTNENQHRDCRELLNILQGKSDE